ncbi:PREDICTED: LRR receptor serine/threonine- [Prunus dulcis]|uniref:PREDICTED: LRR receptor serine/threonine n=1 Tax=Prunus dulcis TaxID=3755 RepID=A0A5E4G139_PRUDU|nr:PREDICTED: LRR receptor serine/threonine- [Prunus dulcis]
MGKLRLGSGRGPSTPALAMLHSPCDFLLRRKLGYSATISSNKGSQSPNSQVPLSLWDNSKVYKKIFVANLYCVTTEAHFHKWSTTYASAIPNDVHVKLEASLTDDVPRVDSNDPEARIITFFTFYFSLGFKFPLSS